MATDYNSIREALQFKELSEEEKKARGILGRLYGPCASVIAPTRNGRKYSDELWEKVFNENEIVKEMLACSGIPMELDHPADREETCSEKIAAMLPEAPKRDKDGHLICYVDLIDTPCGRIAYQLAKYGFKLGISSRGTGDLYTDNEGNEAVDPDTYDFTTFDLVLLPAVKDARLQMTESVDTKMVKAKKALKESYENASAEDKLVMQEELNRLNISLEEAVEEVEVEEIKAEDIPWADDELDSEEPVNSLVEEKEEVEDTVEEMSEEEIEEEPVEEVENIESSEEEIETTKKAYTVGDLIKEIQDYDENLNIEFKPIEIEGKEYPVEMLEFDPTEEGKLVVEIGYNQEIGDNIEGEEVEEPSNEETVQEEPVEEEIPEVEETEEVNDVEDEVVESMKEMIRQKGLLEQEVKTLKSEKTVSDAEVGKLKEELEKYKTSFMRTSTIAAKVSKLEADNKTLTEKLSKQAEELTAQRKLVEAKQTKETDVKTLTESVHETEHKVKVLTERLVEKQKELDAKENDMTAQATQYESAIAKKSKIVEAYKARYQNVMTKYVESKAKMLGVNANMITSRLTEQYTLEDVDKVCDELFDYNINISKLPFNLAKGSKVNVNESKQTTATPKDGYDIDDSLLELAGLK